MSSRQSSFGPLSQYHAPTTTSQHHQKPSAQTQAVSPLSARFPGSPTRGYLSPVSIVSPELSLPPELLHHDHYYHYHHHAPTAATAPEVPQTVHLARGGTLHLQDHMPFQQAAPPARTPPTRFPLRKPVIKNHNQPSAGKYPGEQPGPSSSFSSSERPVTTYLADHQPHRLAAAAPTPLPIPTTTRPYPYPNDRVTSNHEAKAKPPHHHQSQGPTFHSMGLQDVELGVGHVPTTTTNARPAAPTRVIRESESEEAAERTAYEVKRRRRNCVIGCVFGPTLVAIIVVFAVLVIRANKP